MRQGWVRPSNMILVYPRCAEDDRKIMGKFPKLHYQGRFVAGKIDYSGFADVLFFSFSIIIHHVGNLQGIRFVLGGSSSNFKVSRPLKVRKTWGEDG